MTRMAKIKVIKLKRIITIVLNLLTMCTATSHNARLNDIMQRKLGQISFCNLYPTSSHICRRYSKINKSKSLVSLQRSKRFLPVHTLIKLPEKPPICKTQPCQMTHNYITIQVSWQICHHMILIKFVESSKNPEYIIINSWVAPCWSWQSAISRTLRIRFWTMYRNLYREVKWEKLFINIILLSVEAGGIIWTKSKLIQTGLVPRKKGVHHKIAFHFMLPEKVK